MPAPEQIALQPILRDVHRYWFGDLASPANVEWQLDPRFKEMYLGRWPKRAGVPLNTDEHPRVEFLAPISHRQHSLLEGERLTEYKRRVLDRL